MSNEEILIHCPECPGPSFFGIIKQEGKNGKNEFLEYKCRFGHEGQKSILDFGENELKNYSKIPCKFCKKTNYNMNYCFECKENICDENNCLLNHSNLKHKKIINLKNINNYCLKHLQPYEYYCQTCKILLCLNCPNYHIKHNLISTFTIENEKIDNIEIEFKEFENNFNQIIITDLGKYISNLNRTYNFLKDRCLKELQFINSLLKASKLQNNKLNFEIIDTIKNLKFHNLDNIQSTDTKIKYLIKNKFYNILEQFDIKNLFKNKQLFLGEENLK